VSLGRSKKSDAIPLAKLASKAKWNCPTLFDSVFRVVRPTSLSAASDWLSWAASEPSVIHGLNFYFKSNPIFPQHLSAKSLGPVLAAAPANVVRAILGLKPTSFSANTTRFSVAAYWTQENKASSDTVLSAFNFDSLTADEFTSFVSPTKLLTSDEEAEFTKLSSGTDANAVSQLKIFAGSKWRAQ